MTSCAPTARIRDTISALLLPGLLLLALALRVWGAWMLRFSTDSDTGIVYLMVRHMLDGSAWPVFFYGQSYMGNVEPALSAALCALSQNTPFMVNLGTAVIGWLALVVAARWARDAIGRTGAIWVVLLGMIGPPTYYGFQVSPRGGYAVTVFLATLLVWWLCRIILAERRTGTLRPGFIFIWGFLAGLGWWANSLILPALLTAALVALFGWNRSLWNVRRLLSGGIGFLIGSAPFWVWSARHQGDSLAIFQNFDPAAFGRRSIALFTQRLPDFFEVPQAPVWIWLSGLVLILLPLGVALGRILRDRQQPQALFLSAALLQAGLTLAGYSATRFADTGLVRYLVPFFLPWALLVAATLHSLARHTPVLLAWLLVALLTAGSLHTLPDFSEKSARDARARAQAQRLQSFCRTHRVPAVYASFRHHWMNAAFGEQPALVTLERERCFRNGRFAESQAAPGILEDAGGLTEFLAYGGGSAHRAHIPGTPWALCTDFRPPPEAQPLPDLSRLAAARDSRNTDRLKSLTDGNLDTTCVLGETAAPDTWIFTFHPPVDLDGLRFYLDPPDGHLPPLTVEVQAGTDAWQTVAGPLSPTRFFWSGPRPYWGGYTYHFDVRWPTRNLDALKMSFATGARPALIHVAEIEFLTPVPNSCRPSPEAAERDLQALFALIRARRPSTVYADRWVSARLATQPDLAHLGQSGDFPIDWNAPMAERPVVDCAPGTLLVVSRGHASLCAQRLPPSQPVHRTPVGPWEIFEFSPPPHQPAAQDAPDPLVWTGQGLLRSAEPAPPGESPMPDLSTPVQFGNGAQLVGVSPISPISARAGQTLHLRYVWTCPPHVDPHRYAVFTHFRSEKALFQDDHLWLAAYSPAQIRRQTQPRRLTVERAIPLPENLPAGIYRLHIGLLDNRTSKRVPCQSEYPTRHQAVELPVEIRIDKP